MSKNFEYKNYEEAQFVTLVYRNEDAEMSLPFNLSIRNSYQ